MDVLVEWEIDGHVFRAGLVTTEEERLECYKFRYRHYHKRLGQIPPHPDEIDVDFADEYSSMICAYDDKQEVVGTVRHIPCEKGCLLTHGRGGKPEIFSGQLFEFPGRHPDTGDIIHLEQVVECSRWIGSPYSTAKGRIAVSWMIVAATMELCRRRGDAYILMALQNEQVKKFREAPWHFTELHPRADGEAHDYHGARVRLGIIFVPQEDRDEDYLKLATS